MAGAAYLPLTAGVAREPRFLRGDKPEGGPIEFAMAASDTRDQPIPDRRQPKASARRPSPPRRAPDARP